MRVGECAGAEPILTELSAQRRGRRRGGNGSTERHQAGGMDHATGVDLCAPLGVDSGPCHEIF